MRILITGGTGMVGSAFKNLDTDHELLLYGSDTYNLLREQDVCDMIYRAHPDAIIHLAAKVGGVKGNSDFVSDFFYENIQMNTNLLETARIYKIPKVLSLLSTCIYPDNPSYPLTEDQIHDGEPHQSNFGYAYAKRMLEVHSRAIRQQYGLNYITAVPNNIYGPNDNFNLENSHVVPAMIRKIYNAKIQNINVKHWGTGKPLREFTYSRDIAKALLLLIESYDSPEPINIGTTDEISIYNLSSIISDLIGFHNDEVWDSSMPDGQYKKPSSNEKFVEMFPDFQYTPLVEGLKETVGWYMDNYPNVRL